MADVLDEIVALAADGSPLTCTLSPESVQVILFALPFVHRRKVWLGSPTDTISDEEWDTIEKIIANVSQELLP